MSIRRFNRNINTHHSPFRGYFKDNFFDQDEFEEHFVPLTNVRTLKEYYELQLALPGYDKSDLHLQVENNVLTISAREVKESEITPDFNRREFYKSPFTRSFELPEDVDEDKINARMDKGILSVEIGRHDNDPKPRSRKIEIETGNTTKR